MANEEEKSEQETGKDEVKAAAGARGGFARAEALSPEERKDIARRAAAARWDPNVPQAAHSGELTIGKMTFPCSVLSDKTRILTQSDFMKGMGMYYSGWVAKNRPAEDVAADVPLFLSFRSLKPFIDQHLGDLQSIVVRYRTERGNLALGIKAEIIPKICDVWIDADEQGTLGQRQKLVAKKARLLMRALAHVGIIALVDEATGYQDMRARDALAKILEEFVAKELRKWVKTFPMDFYREMCRLRGWSFNASSTKRGPIFGKLTNNLVYLRLAPGVLAELQRVTPKDEKGRYKAKLFQSLTESPGHPRLREHLAAVIALMKATPDREWTVFMRMLDRSLPKYPKRFNPDQFQLKGFEV
jgi:hypothetical protein